MEMNLPLLRAEGFQSMPPMLRSCDLLIMLGIRYVPSSFDQFEHVVMREGSAVENRVSHQNLFGMLKNGDASIEYNHHGSGRQTLRDALRGRTLSDFTPGEIKRAKFLASLSERYFDHLTATSGT